MNTSTLTTSISTNGPTTTADPFGVILIDLYEAGQRATKQIVEIFDRFVVVVREVFPPPVDDARQRIEEMFRDLEESAALDDWKHVRSLAALRRRESPRVLTTQVTARTVAPRLVKVGRAPRRGPGRSRALLGRAHPLNRIEEEA